MSFTVKDIAKTLRDSKKQGTPVIVFTGAGCSKSAGMPLANELISEINKRFKGHLKSLNDEQRKDYGACMSQLVPSEQKNLIEKHIKKSKINWAHIALSSLLKSGYLGKVLTFNFDNILNRACSLDNFYPPTYDLKVLSEEYFSAIPNQSIIHLHGQWSGFQLANSDIDTKKQAEKLKTFIKNTINNSPTLFIGYSGGADAFFKLVEENFIGQHRLFWIDYAKEPNINVKQFIDVNPNHRNFIGEQDADRFLLELAIELNCFPTELFKDPIKHLKGICELVNQFPLPTSDTEIDILEDTKKTLAIADANKPAITTIKLAELLHAKKFEAIINQEKNLDLSIKPISKVLASAFLGKALSFLTKDDNQFHFNFDKAIKLEPNFYQAYAKAGIVCAKFFEDTKKGEYIEQSIIYFQNVFRIKPDLNNPAILMDYCSANALYSQYKQEIGIFKKTDDLYKNLLQKENSDANLIGNYGLFLSDYAYFTSDINIYKNAIAQLKLSTDLNPLDDNHLSNYGSTLGLFGLFTKDEFFLKQAIKYFEKALEINPSESNYKHNTSMIMYNTYTINKDISYLESAKTKSESALEKSKNRPEYLRMYGIILFEYGKIENQDSKLQLSYDYLTKAAALDSTNTYNLACYYAFNSNLELCKKHLLQTEKYSKLPKSQILISDEDLDNVHNEPWFIELLERLKEKEDNKVA
jgi:tetratricopeptide (TPR) repeat protein/NAD-dependent SIR2 family protein deacetylase